MITKLPKLAMQRPITVAMVVITVIGLGFITANRTPVDLLPALDLPFLAVFIPFPVRLLNKSSRKLPFRKRHQR